MKPGKHISPCRCCPTQYWVRWKHHNLQLDINNWRNAELGFDVMIYTRRRHNFDGPVGRFRVEINLLWFTLYFERRFLNKWWDSKSGNLDIYPFADVCISAQVRMHQYPLNAKWDWGWVVSCPFLPTVTYHRCRLRTEAEEKQWESEQ